MALTLTEVESGYGDLTIVNNVDLNVDNEEIVTIIGPNGAGKSTLLKTIVGVLNVRNGTIKIDDTDITGLSSDEVIREGVGYVPQENNVFPDLTVKENLRLSGWILDGDFDDRINEVYEQFPLLEEREGQKAGTLSGGQQQMLAIGMVLLIDPDIIIMDEPSAGLAPNIIDDVFEKIASINELGTAILMVEQNARAALELSDRGYVLVDGEVRFDGSGEEILESEEVGDLYLGEQTR